MKESEVNFASGKLARLQSEFLVNVDADWKYKDAGSVAWDSGSWSIAELDHLHTAIALLADAMGGGDKLIQNLGGVKVQKLDIGSHAGNAIAHHVNLNTKGSFSAWTIKP
jgi:hypothetical protein